MSIPATHARPIPIGILLYVGFLGLISLNTTLLGYFAPELLFGEGAVGIHASAVTAFYATRNLAIFVLCAVALLSQSAAVVYAVLLVRLVVELVDLGFTLSFELVSLPAPAVVFLWMIIFTGPQLACLWMLRDRGAGRHFGFQQEVRVGVDREAVWAKLTAHEQMPDWVKLGLRWVKLLPDGTAAVGTPGSLRRIRFSGWPPVTERFGIVEPARRYSYAVVAGMPHLRDHLGVVELEDDGDGTRISWSIDFVFHPLHPLSWMAPMFVAGFRKVVQAALLELAKQLEENP